MKREKSAEQERIFVEHLGGLKKSDFCNFEKPRKSACQKKMIEFNEQRKERG